MKHLSPTSNLVLCRLLPERLKSVDCRPLGFSLFALRAIFISFRAALNACTLQWLLTTLRPTHALHPVDFLHSTSISAGLFISMFMKLFVPVLLVLSSAVTSVFSLPALASSVFARGDHEDKNSTQSNGNKSTTVRVIHLNDTATRFPDFEYLAMGNKHFRSAVKNSSNPDLLKELTENGQHPGYLFLGCRFVTILHIHPMSTVSVRLISLFFPSIFL